MLIEIKKHKLLKQLTELESKVNTGINPGENLTRSEIITVLTVSNLFHSMSTNNV